MHFYKKLSETISFFITDFLLSRLAQLVEHLPCNERFQSQVS